MTVSIIGGVIAALLTMWLSLRRFYKERWWQRRFDGCAAVIEALHDIKRFLDIQWQEDAEGASYNKKFKEAARLRSEEGMRALRRYSDLGRLALPEGMAEIVKTYIREYDAEGPHDAWLDWVDTEQFRVTKALQSVPAAAMRGLRLAGH